MMSMIAGEGTNSDEREVTMTVQGREKTDAEMIGMTGKTMVWESLYNLGVYHEAMSLKNAGK